MFRATRPQHILTTLLLAVSLSACFVNGGRPYTSSEQALPAATLATQACERRDLSAFKTMAARSADPTLTCSPSPNPQAEEGAQ